jgi:hypothetical protein
MTTETVEDYEPELKELEMAVPFKWEIVEDTWRKTPKTKYLDDLVTQSLKEGKTLKIEDETTRLDKYSRWAAANNLILHRKSFPGFVIVWADEKKA